MSEAFLGRWRAVAAVAVAAAALPAAASLVTLQTRSSSAGPAAAGSETANGAWYRDTVQGLLAQAPGTGFCDTTLASFGGLSNHGGCASGSSSNVAYAITVDFGVSALQGADISFRLAPDFGRGGSVYLDGVLLGVRTNDMWWGGSWAAGTNNVFEFLNLTMGAGNHRLSIFGLEGCCDGDQRGEFRVGQGSWSVLGTGDALTLRATNVVPQPSSLSLVLAAAMGLGSVYQLRRERRRRAAARRQG